MSRLQRSFMHFNMLQLSQSYFKDRACRLRRPCSTLVAYTSDRVTWPANRVHVCQPGRAHATPATADASRCCRAPARHQLTQRCASLAKASGSDSRLRGDKAAICTAFVKAVLQLPWSVDSCSAFTPVLTACLKVRLRSHACHVL